MPVNSKLGATSPTMTSLSDIELIQRLLLAAAIGALIGAERELRRKSAGFRTNILIALVVIVLRLLQGRKI